MSRSNNTEVRNPSKRFYEWSGSTGKLKYFDKTKGEKGENVTVELPFRFLVLDTLHTIKGFSDAQQAGFFSNEVRDLKKETLTVRTKNGIQATGLYSTLAGVLNKGASYCQSVYIAMKGEDGKLEICNLQLTGSGIGPWIDFCKKHDKYKGAITISGSVPKKKGTTNYFEPIFTFSPNVTPEMDQQAIELDKQLQEYLKSYFSRTASEIQDHNSTQAAAESTNASIAEPQEDLDAINTELLQPQFSGGDADDLPF